MISAPVVRTPQQSSARTRSPRAETRPLRILMVSYSSFLQRFYQTLPQQIARQSGAEVHVLVPPRWKELWSGTAVELEWRANPAFQGHVGDILFTGNLHFAVFRNRLGTLIRTLQPDVIDLEDEPFNLGSLQMELLRRRHAPRAKLVLHASQNVYKTYPPPFQWVERRVLQGVEAVLIRNRSAGEVLRRKGYQGRLEVITHGVDTDAFRPRPDPALKRELSPDGRPIVGFVGSLVAQKGIPTLIDAVAELPVRLLVVGGGEEREALVAHAARRGVDAVFRPPANHEMVSRFMNTMDAFVLPSRTMPGLVEKFGRVLIEAMACGVPVIGSSSGEIPNVIGEAGIVFPEGDVEGDAGGGPSRRGEPGPFRRHESARTRARPQNLLLERHRPEHAGSLPGVALRSVRVKDGALVHINARFLSQPVSGVQRYGRELLRSVDALLDRGDPVVRGLRFRVLAPGTGPLHVPALQHLDVERVGRTRGHLWEQLTLPRFVGRGILFCPGNTAPLASLPSRRVVVTLHGLAYRHHPASYSRAFRILYNVIVPQVLRRAAAILTVSETERSTIVDAYPAADQRVTVAPLGGLSAGVVPPSPVPRRSRAATLLYVGSLNPLKNLQGVLDAFALLPDRLDARLVVVGGRAHSFESAEYRVSPAVRHRVEFRGQIDDTTELVELYGRSAALVFPSYYEACPLPPLEAMACGCPVLASSIPALRERLGDAALYCSPSDTGSIADGMRRLLADDDLHASLAAAGLERAARSTWESCARTTVEVFRRVLGMPVVGDPVETQNASRSWSPTVPSRPTTGIGTGVSSSGLSTQ